MQRSLSITNRQNRFLIKESLLEPILHQAMDSHLELKSYDLSIAFLSPEEIQTWNESHLNHQGPCDVLTYDYSELEFTKKSKCPHATESIAGELLVCPEVASLTAPEYRKSWQNETTRYCIHGILHLMGYDDIEPEDRTIMKAEENRLMTLLESQYDFASIGTREHA